MAGIHHKIQFFIPRKEPSCSRPPAHAPSLVMDRSGIAARMTAAGLHATRRISHRVVNTSIIRGIDIRLLPKYRFSQ